MPNLSVVTVTLVKCDLFAYNANQNFKYFYLKTTVNHLFVCCCFSF